MLSVGVDAHKGESHLTVLSARGKVLKSVRIKSNRRAVRAALSGFGRPLKATLEASYCWGPMYDWLSEVCEAVVLAHPLKVRAIAEARIKTDAIDSKTLAQLLRADLIPAAYAPTHETRSKKRVLRQRQCYVKIRTMIKNRLQALLAQYDLKRPDVSDLFGVAGMQWLKALVLPGPDQGLFAEDLALLAELNRHIKKTDAMVKDLARNDPVVAWLVSIPGIGMWLAVLIRYEVDDMERFRTASKFASYTGLIPSTYASGDRIRHGRLTKQGNKWLRWAFVEAVTGAKRTSPALRAYYERIKCRRGTKAARVATARKLAELTWTLWTEQRPYEER